jgi:hypothetical protein
MIRRDLMAEIGILFEDNLLFEENLWNPLYKKNLSWDLYLFLIIAQNVGCLYVLKELTAF